jgi:ATP-dependent Clp protease ATP-binding subunit ClpB
MNLLLGVLDDGRLTDSAGRTVSFANTVIILTSNLGSDILIESVAGVFNAEKFRTAKEMVLRLVHQHFRPEFLNRLDETVIFHPLTTQQLREVARLQANELNARLAQRNIVMEVNDRALSFIAEQAFDVKFGARPLRRWMEHHIMTHLSRMVVAGQLEDNSKVMVDLAPNGKDLVYTVEKLPMPANAAEDGAGAMRVRPRSNYQQEQEDDDYEDEMESD